MSWKKTGRVMGLIAICGGCAAAPIGRDQPSGPRLAVVVVVDQMRADYLERLDPRLEHGLARLQAEGTMYLDAHHDHAQTHTAVGHATLLSGRHPASTGIIANKWPDRGQRKIVRAIRDDAERSFDGGPGVSPRRLEGSNLGDWLLQARPESKLVSVSGKSRAAILMAGHRARNVYWYSRTRGEFTSSTYYSDSLPRWVSAFNRRRSATDFLGQEWRRFGPPGGAQAGCRNDDAAFELDKYGLGRAFPHRFPSNPHRLFKAFIYSPFMDQLTLELATEAVDKLDLGGDLEPDLLLVSLSALDSIGHIWGPFSHEVYDHLLRLDAMLGEFFHQIEERVGKDGVLLVVTADHGVNPIPEFVVAQGGRAGWVDLEPATLELDAEMDAELGDGDWIVGLGYGVLYLDRPAILNAGGLPEVWAARAAESFSAIDGVARVATREQLMDVDEPRDEIERRMVNSYHPQRGGDVFAVLEPGFLVYNEDYVSGEYAMATNHGTPYSSDSHVPLIFAGAGVESARISRPVRSVDLAPTLAKLLGIEPGEAVDGEVLHEVAHPATAAAAAGW